MVHKGDDQSANPASKNKPLRWILPADNGVDNYIVHNFAFVYILLYSTVAMVEYSASDIVLRLDSSMASGAFFAAPVILFYAFLVLRSIAFLFYSDKPPARFFSWVVSIVSMAIISISFVATYSSVSALFFAYLSLLMIHVIVRDSRYFGLALKLNGPAKGIVGNIFSRSRSFEGQSHKTSPSLLAMVVIKRNFDSILLVSIFSLTLVSIIAAFASIGYSTVFIKTATLLFRVSSWLNVNFPMNLISASFFVLCVISLALGCAVTLRWAGKISKYAATCSTAFAFLGIMSIGGQHVDRSFGHLSDISLPSASSRLEAEAVQAFRVLVLAEFLSPDNGNAERATQAIRVGYRECLALNAESTESNELTDAEYARYAEIWDPATDYFRLGSETLICSHRRFLAEYISTLARLRGWAAASSEFVETSRLTQNFPPDAQFALSAPPSPENLSARLEEFKLRRPRVAALVGISNQVSGDLIATLSGMLGMESEFMEAVLFDGLMDAMFVIGDEVPAGRLDLNHDRARQVAQDFAIDSRWEGLASTDFSDASFARPAILEMMTILREDAEVARAQVHRHMQAEGGIRPHRTNGPYSEAGEALLKIIRRL